MNRTHKIVVIIWALFSLFSLTLLDCWFGGLKFVSDAVNVTAGITAALLPAVCLILLGFLPRSRARMWAFVCLIPGAPFCFILGSIAVSSQAIPIKTQHASVRLGSSQIVTYFSDAGAWDSGEVIVQQEVTLLPGLLWVRPLSRHNCLRDVQIKVLNRHYVECDYPADTVDSGDPSPEEKRDKAWVF